MIIQCLTSIGSSILTPWEKQYSTNLIDVSHMPLEYLERHYNPVIISDIIDSEISDLEKTNGNI